MNGIKLTPKKITTWLIATGLATGLLHIVSFFPMLIGTRDVPLNMLNLDAEQSIGALFSTTLLWLCALCCAFIAQSDIKPKSYRNKWGGLALIFFFLGLDETLCFHEKVNGIILSDTGIRSLGWTLPYAVAFLLFGITYLKFLFELPRKTRFQVIGAGALFVTGAIGLELINGGFKATNYGKVYYTLVAAEELSETGGCILFIHACTSYIATCIPNFRIMISTESSSRSVI